MDIIDIVLGHALLHARDIERYLEETHGVTVPVWTPSAPTGGTVSVSELTESLVPVPKGQVQQAIENYPHIPRIGTLTDPIDTTRPTREDTTADPVDEERTVTLSTEDYSFFITAIRDYTDLDATEIEERFDNHTFTGTWDEFTELFWGQFDAVLEGLYDASIGDEEEKEIRMQTNRLKWQTAIDWHRDTDQSLSGTQTS